jgi:methionyl aminopeptidase
MSLVKTAKEIETLREGGKILAAILSLVAKRVRPGITTRELDELAREEIKKAGATSAFEGYKIVPDGPPYPAVLCTSINDEVVHGIPSRTRVLKDGDIIGLDFGIKYQGLYTDAAITVPVGTVSSDAHKLIATTELALEKGIEQAVPGHTIGDIAAAIQKVADEAGFGIIRDLVGHGVGHAIHEMPNVPNYGRAGSMPRLKVGMVLAIEPMFTTGSYQVKFLLDRWTVATADGSLAAHFEHTIALTQNGPVILTV